MAQNRLRAGKSLRGDRTAYVKARQLRAFGWLADQGRPRLPGQSFEHGKARHGLAVAGFCTSSSGWSDQPFSKVRPHDAHAGARVVVSKLLSRPADRNPLAALATAAPRRMMPAMADPRPWACSARRLGRLGRWLSRASHHAPTGLGLRLALVTQKSRAALPCSACAIELQDQHARAREARAKEAKLCGS